MDLTKGDIKKHLTHLAIPSGTAYFFATMFFIVDTYFAGTISTEAQAALSISFPVYFILISVMQGLSVGAQTLIANSLGEGNEEKARRLIIQSLYFGCIFSFFVSLAGYFWAHHLLYLLGAKGVVAEYAAEYISLTFLFSIFAIINHVLNGVLMSYGIAKPFRNWLIIGFLLHLIFDPWFISGGGGIPPLGFQGIVYSIVLTTFFGIFYMSYCLFRRGLIRGMHMKDYTFSFSAFLELGRQSIPASLNLLCIAFGLFITTGFVFQYGKEAAAAYGIGMRVQQLFLLPTIGFASAALSIISQNNGAGIIERVQECIKSSFRFGFIIMLFGFIAMIYIPEILIGFFTRDPEVIRFGAAFLRVSSVTGFFLMAQNILIVALQGMKRPLAAFYIGLGRQILFPLILLWMLVVYIKAPLESVWFMILAVNCIFAILSSILVTRVLNERKRALCASGKTGSKK